MKRTVKTPIQPDWWRKSLAGCILGYTLTLAIVGLFAWIGPGGIEAMNKVQFNMWIMAPTWMLIWSLTYLFKTGNRAVAYLATLNVIAYTCFFIAREAIKT